MAYRDALRLEFIVKIRDAILPDLSISQLHQETAIVALCDVATEIFLARYDVPEVHRQEIVSAAIHGMNDWYTAWQERGPG